MKQPEISLIIPVFNEADGLGRLFRSLASQYGTDLELIISDGGSSDATMERAERLTKDFPFPVRLVTGAKGRGRQLNAGATIATGATLLFLHADSAFTDSRAIRKGLDYLNEAIASRGDERVAGHFALQFDYSHTKELPAFYFYECKARMNRPGCIHGDQGFMMRRDFFTEIGPFDETLPFLEDTRLAETIREHGEWLLLPASIHTSARRFESEGLVRRQTLNAIIMNLNSLGRDQFLSLLHETYQSQDRTTRLKLAPILRKIKTLIRTLPFKERLRFWYETGTYVRANVWQLPFALDVRKCLAMGLPADKCATPCLSAYERHLDRLTDNPPGRFAATALVWFWFRLICLAAFLREYQFQE
jgi:rSAM/selenodomain-associated transferase 2